MTIMFTTSSASGNAFWMRCVRDERYKLIHFYNIGEWELYDLEEDPQEVRNVYGDSSYARVEQRLKRELERLREVYRVSEDTDPVEGG